MEARAQYFLIIRLMDWSESRVPLGLEKKYSQLLISEMNSALYFSRSIKTSLLPIWIIRSFEPFPYMRIAAIFKSTSTFLKLHSSEILMPVENNVSHIAISRRVRFYLTKRIFFNVIFIFEESVKGFDSCKLSLSCFGFETAVQITNVVFNIGYGNGLYIWIV